MYKPTWVTHTFAGGWATDFGTTVYHGPDNSGGFRLPFLIDAQNVVYEFDGGPRKKPGTNTLNSTAMESGASVFGVFDYWRQGTSGTASQKRVIHVSTKIKKDDADGTFTDIFSNVEPNVIPQYSTFDDLLIIGSSSTVDAPRSWDQSTAQLLAGSPPRFSFSVNHKNRQWAAGVYTTPSRLYYSENLDPEDWTGAGSGAIDLDPNDGDMIVGIISHKNELLVFKGPYKGSIHRITGSAPADFARTTLFRGISAAWINNIFTYGDDIGFISPRGTVHSLNATAAYGDYNQSYLSYPINSYLRSELNHSRHRFWHAVNDPANGYVLLSVSRAGVARNDVILMMDYRFLAQGDRDPRWALWTDFGAQSLALAFDTSNRQRVFAGGNDGFVYRLDQANRTHDDTAITYKVTTPSLTYGSDLHTKTLYVLGAGIAPRNANSFTLGWQRDNVAYQFETLIQGGADVLGPWPVNQFTLNTSTLGGAAFSTRFVEAETGGEFKAIRYQVTDTANNSDLELHSIGAGIAGGSASTENV